MTRLGDESECYLVFGGCDGSSHALGDMFLLEVDGNTCHWHQVEASGDVPQPRFGHTVNCTQFRGNRDCEFVLYGGYDGRRQMFGDLHRLDLRFDEARSRFLVDSPFYCSGCVSRNLV